MVMVYRWVLYLASLVMFWFMVMVVVMLWLWFMDRYLASWLCYGYGCGYVMLWLWLCYGKGLRIGN